jgi:hypothetical protein
MPYEGYLNMRNRIYLDNCCFNRPYDDRSNFNVHLEAQAKIFIQNEIFGLFKNLFECGQKPTGSLPAAGRLASLAKCFVFCLFLADLFRN